MFDTLHALIDEGAFEVAWDLCEERGWFMPPPSTGPHTDRRWANYPQTVTADRTGSWTRSYWYGPIPSWTIMGTRQRATATRSPWHHHPGRYY